MFLGRRTELTYRLERLEPNRLTFVGRSATVTSTDDLTFSPTGEATSITYRARVQFSGPAKLATPILRLLFERLADKVAAQISSVVDAL